MPGLGVVLVDLLEAGAPPGGHVDLAADDGLDPRRLAGPVEVHRAVHDPVVRDGYGGLAQLPDPLCQTVDAAEAVQEAVFGVDVKVNEGHGNLSFLTGDGSGYIRPYPCSYLTPFFSFGQFLFFKQDLDSVVNKNMI